MQHERCASWTLEYEQTQETDSVSLISGVSVPRSFQAEKPPRASFAAGRCLMSALTRDLHVCRSKDVVNGDRIDLIRDHGMRLEGDRSQ